MVFSYNKLQGRIVEVFGTRAKFAKAIGLSEHTVSRKLNNKAEWRRAEIMRAVETLQLQANDIEAYFFNLQPQD